MNKGIITNYPTCGNKPEEIFSTGSVTDLVDAFSQGGVDEDLVRDVEGLKRGCYPASKDRIEDHVSSQKAMQDGSKKDKSH